MDEYGVSPLPEIDEVQVDDGTECSLPHDRSFVLHKVGPGSKIAPHLGAIWAVGRPADDVFIQHRLNSLIAPHLG